MQTIARPLRVALCFGTFPPERNGGADFLRHFALALADAGTEVTVLTAPADAPPYEEVAPGVVVARIVDDWSVSRRGRQALARAGRLLRERGVHVVHVFFPDPGLAGSYQVPAALGAPRIPLVTTFWNLGLGRRSPWRLRAEALALIARSRVLTSHDPGYLRALRALAAGSRPVHWLPVGNNLAATASWAVTPERRRQAGLEPTSAHLAFFGQLDFTRGVDDLFRAVALLREVVDVRLVLIGAARREDRYVPGSDALRHYRGLQTLPRRLGIDDAVHWTEYLPDEDAAELLAAVDLCVLPYRRNSLGRSALVAALAVGTPTVVAGSVDGIAPLRAGTHVALTPPGDPAALAETVRALLDDPAQRERLAEGGHRAARMFAWPRLADAALALYREALVR